MGNVDGHNSYTENNKRIWIGDALKWVFRERSICKMSFENFNSFGCNLLPFLDCFVCENIIC